MYTSVQLFTVWYSDAYLLWMKGVLLMLVKVLLEMLGGGVNSHF